MQHNYTETLELGRWLIKISPSTQYGYFENMMHGGGGGLWFDRKGRELVDYDGVAELPKTVFAMLVGAGYNLDAHILEDY